jgi:hypothetical protein
VYPVAAAGFSDVVTRPSDLDTLIGQVSWRFDGSLRQESDVLR